MTNEKKIFMLEEIMELEHDTLSENTILSELDEWNSMAALSLIIFSEEEFNKKLSGKQIKEFRTIKDILDFLC